MFYRITIRERDQYACRSKGRAYHVAMLSCDIALVLMSTRVTLFLSRIVCSRFSDHALIFVYFLPFPHYIHVDT